jgi:hypothetical protein
MMKRFLALALHLLLCAQAPADRLIPQDTTDRAPHFGRFREELERAVDQRDGAFFQRRAEAARLSYGSDVDLDAKFDLSDPNSEFWSITERMLELGGSWQADSEMVVYPYAYANFPKGIQASNHDVVTGQDVPLLHSADGESFPVGSLSYDIVWVLERGAEWSRVRTDDGVTGWVENRFLYSPTGYRMGFALVEGRWSLVFWMAGN